MQEMGRPHSLRDRSRLLRLIDYHQRTLCDWVPEHGRRYRVQWLCPLLSDLVQVQLYCWLRSLPSDRQALLGYYDMNLKYLFLSKR
jgi:hypothetical protein